MFELFAIDASMRPAGFPIAETCVLDETSMSLFDTIWVEDGYYCVPSDEHLEMRWGDNEPVRRTLVVEELPIEVAVTLTNGIESFFNHVVFTRFDLDESGRAVSIASRRFGEPGYGNFGSDVLRQANVAMAALEAVGVGSDQI
jgi:hypothetical protein